MERRKSSRPVANSLELVETLFGGIPCHGMVRYDRLNKNERMHFRIDRVDLIPGKNLD